MRYFFAAIMLLAGHSLVHSSWNALLGSPPYNRYSGWVYIGTLSDGVGTWIDSAGGKDYGKHREIFVLKNSSVPVRGVLSTAYRAIYDCADTTKYVINMSWNFDQPMATGRQLPTGKQIDFVRIREAIGSEHDIVGKVACGQLPPANPGRASARPKQQFAMSMKGNGPSAFEFHVACHLSLQEWGVNKFPISVESVEYLAPVKGSNAGPIYPQDAQVIPVKFVMKTGDMSLLGGRLYIWKDPHGSVSCARPM